MNMNLTDITLVVDRSGSMQSIREDAEGGVNAFIERQAGEEGDAVLTLVQFDTEYEFLTRGEPVVKVQPFRLVPRGATALLDAVGRAISETGARIARMAEQDRPGLVVFVVMTDGHENSSREFTKAEIKKMIEHQQSVYNWQFTFLGADQDAFDEAGSMGMAADGVANYSRHKVMAAYANTGEKVARMRSSARRGEEVDNRFTDEEREDMS
ncbi:MAG: vWA domain-containing protein [Pirellulaceae bacterium]